VNAVFGARAEVAVRCRRARTSRMTSSQTWNDVRFTNRSFGVKHFQTIHHFSVDVAHGLALLFGISTKALPSWGSRTRWNNLLLGLAVRRTAGPSRHANSPHPSSREGHHSNPGWSSRFLLLDLILDSFHAAAALFPGPAKLSTVDPDAVRDHGQPACQSHDRLSHPARAWRSASPRP
jgi:hypothetical protein